MPPADAQILRAVLTRDPEAAADAALRHLNGTLRSLHIRPIDAGGAGAARSNGDCRHTTVSQPSY